MEQTDDPKQRGEGMTQGGELGEPELRFWWSCLQTRGRGGKDEGRSGELPQAAEQGSSRDSLMSPCSVYVEPSTLLLSFHPV